MQNSRAGDTLSPIWRLLISLGSGVALGLAFPDYNLPVLGWVALAGLIFGCLGARSRLAAACGLLFGLVYYFLTIPWIYSVLHEYGPVPAWQAAGLLLLLSFVMSLFFAAFGALVARLSKRSEGLALAAAPFLWVALEFARAHMPDIGFPWNLLGYTAANNLALLQIVSFTGIYGLSLVVGAYNSLLLWTALSIRDAKTRSFSNRAILTFVGATAVLLAVGVPGASLVPQAPPTSVAHLVQTNLPQSLEYKPDWDIVHAGDMQQLEQLTAGAGQRQPGLVVWPEVPAPFSLQEPAFAERAARMARESQSYFLLGVVHWKSMGNQMHAFNSVSMLDPEGRQSFVYDKIHLVPFSEYMPWRSWLWFASDLTTLISDFSTGSDYSVGQIPGGRFSVFICYEAIFPDQVRRYVENGAELLINVSNDGWFGQSSALGQHVAMARVRAAENRRWLLRDTNTGETVSVDPYGRIVARLPRYTRGELDAPYAFRSDLTLYTRWGDWLAWLSMVLSVLALAKGLRSPARIAGRPELQSKRLKGTR